MTSRGSLGGLEAWSGCSDSATAKGTSPSSCLEGALAAGSSEGAAICAGAGAESTTGGSISAVPRPVVAHPARNRDASVSRVRAAERRGGVFIRPMVLNRSAMYACSCQKNLKLSVGIERSADGVKVPAGDVVQTSQSRIGALELPVPVVEHTRVSPSPDNLAYKQIVSLLVMRLADDGASEPRGTAFHKRQVVGPYLKQ